MIKLKHNRWQIVSDDSVWMFPADVQLSTVQLPKIELEGAGDLYDGTPYESCLFLANGESDVVARYATQEEAIAGHIKLEQKYGLKRCSKLKI